MHPDHVAPCSTPLRTNMQPPKDHEHMSGSNTSEATHSQLTLFKHDHHHNLTIFLMRTHELLY